MRVKKEIVNINYDDTAHFFENRALKYSKDNPYSTTMYQDNNKELVIERDIHEKEKILPLLRLDVHSKILDIACGIGRWADAIDIPISKYVGIDFSENLISIARERVQRDSFFFEVESATSLMKLSQDSTRGGKFNRFISAGLLMYLNDEDVKKVLSSIEALSDNDTIVYIREPIAINERLTLKDFYSEELHSEYNAVYRTKAEYDDLLYKTLLNNGFFIEESGFLFDEDSLNNRKETSQYYYILHKEPKAARTGYIFLFSLDSVLLKKNIIDELACTFNRSHEIAAIMASNQTGQTPYREKLLQAIDVFNDIPLEKVKNVIDKIPVNNGIVNFINSNIERCYIVSENIDLWICNLLETMGIQKNAYVSKAILDNQNNKCKVISILDKTSIAKQFVTDYVAVGVGDNDADMFSNAAISIAFGGVQNISSAILECVNYAIYDETKLCSFLNKLL